jgi:hypothetical protein
VEVIGMINMNKQRMVNKLPNYPVTVIIQLYLPKICKKTIAHSGPSISKLDPSITRRHPYPSIPKLVKHLKLQMKAMQ